jgi:hypothetical protein
VLLLPTVIFPLFNVSPGSQVEMLGILYQQTARYVIENPNDVTSEEREAIDALLGFDTIAQRYNPAAIDPLKGYGSLEGVEYWPTQAQLTRYLECYIAQGLRHPDSYVKAIGALDGNWFVNVSYGEVTPSIFEWTTTSNEQAVNWYEDVPHYDRPEEIKPLTKQLEQVASFISKIPILSLLFMPVFYMLVIPLLSLMLIIKGSKRYLGLFVPILVSFLFLLVSPATGAWVEPFRYLMPFIYTTPLLIFFALYIKQTGEKKGVPSQDNIQAKALLEEKREGVFDCVV